MIHAVTDVRAIEAALREPVAVLYKHSPRCGASTAAEREVRWFAEGHAEIPVYQVDVVAERALSRLIAARLTLRHASPQVILLREGRVVWSGTHWDVAADALERELERAQAT
ncbi:MAG: bacillithiol system redox-active protein YtxJ [Gemmatimonadota bacterium]|nr:bacillithiol system redox-active protein YtxJ [Gemmatimonadota bacterium]